MEKMRCTIREYCKAYDHEIVGKLTRCPAIETEIDWISGKERRTARRAYVDDAGNEYYINLDGTITVCFEDGCF